jgi:hypothetical protein
MDTATLIRDYFAGEKAEALWILAAGVVALGSSLLLWFWVREPFARGLAAALMLVAALGLAVGGTVYFRSDQQAASLVEQQRADTARFVAVESPRIAQVVRSFGLYRVGYALAVVLALGLVFGSGKPFAHGCAVGLLVLAALGLTIDFFAERRALEYVRGLQSAGLYAPTAGVD